MLLDPVDAKFLDPVRIARIAQEMEDYYVERVRAMQARVAEVARELHEMAARISRLKDRLKQGDPDMTADELQAAFDRAEAKCDLQENQLGQLAAHLAAKQTPAALALQERISRLR